MKRLLKILTLFIILSLSVTGCMPEVEDKDTIVDDKKVENKVLKENLLSNKEYEIGEEIYLTKCADCHKPDGTGVEGSFPPLVASGTLTPISAINAVLHGVEGETEVNGQKYTTSMEKVVLSDAETAKVVNYILNSWGNQKGKVQTADIAEFR